MKKVLILLLTVVCLAATVFVGYQIQGDLNQNQVDLINNGYTVCGGLGGPGVYSEARCSGVSSALTWSPIIAFAVFLTLSVDLLIVDVKLWRHPKTKVGSKPGTP